MAKKEEEEVKPWTPDQPIPDEDGEAEAQRRHMLGRRVKFLDDEAEKSTKKGKKNGSGWGGI
jgi:hypothetical protein